MRRKEGEQMIHELLGHGAKSAVSSAELAQMTGMGERQVRELIERERFEGNLILAGNDGYYLPDKDPNIGRLEVSAFGRSTKTTINGLFAAASQPGGESGRQAVVNLVVDGRTLAQVLFDPLSGVAKQKGLPVGV